MCLDCFTLTLCFPFQCLRYEKTVFRLQSIRYFYQSNAMVAEPRTFNQCFYLVSTRGHTILHITELTGAALSCRSAFLFRRPPLSFTTNIFILPFSRAVWLVSAALIALISFLLYCDFRWEFSKKEDEQQTMNWSDVVLLSLGTVCQQGECLSLSHICKYLCCNIVYSYFSSSFRINT